MLNKFKFIFQQAAGNLKRSVYVFLGLSIAISMVSGLFFYFDSIENAALEKSFNQIDDFNLVIHHVVHPATRVKSHNGIVSDALEVGFDLENYTMFYTMHSEKIKLNGVISDSDSYFKNTTMQTALFNSDFYESDRFKSYFNIIFGEYPKTTNEIMIDYVFSKKFNLTVGQITNWTIQAQYTSTFYINDTLTTVVWYDYENVTDITISGIYAPKLKESILGKLNNIVHYSISDNLTNIDFENTSIGTPIFFSYYDFNDPYDNSPFQKFYTTNSMKFGTMLFYNKENINLNNLYSVTRVLLQKSKVFSRLLGGEVILVYDFSQTLASVSEQTVFLRYSMQIINIPILIFAIVIGSFTTKTNIKNRLEEILLLRTKGMKPRTIRNQILVEAILNGFITSLMGIIIGALVIVQGCKLWLSSLFSFYMDVSNINIMIKLSSFRDIILISIILTTLSSISSIKYISKLKISDLLNVIGENEMDISYDETSLYGDDDDLNFDMEEDNTTIEYLKRKDLSIFNKKIRGVSSELLDLKRRFPSNLVIEEIIASGSTSEKKRKSKKIKRKIMKKSIYESDIENKEKQIRKFSIYLIIFSFLPYILLLIIKTSELQIAPDALISAGNILFGFITSNPLSQLLLFISPIFLVFGLIRFIVIESPSRFAKISSKLSYMFLKVKSYLVGIEMIKKKKVFTTLILMIGIFSSLISFLNIIDNTNSRQDIIIENFNVGADLKITFPEIGFRWVPNVTVIEPSLNSITNIQNQSIIKNIVSYYKEDIGRYKTKFAYFFNFSEYLGIIKEGNKLLPNEEFESNFRDVIQFNNISSTPGAIVSQSFLDLNNLEVGDVYNFTHVGLNKSTYYLYEKVILFKIIHVMDTIPGIYNQSLGYNTPGIYGSSYYTNFNEENVILDVSIIANDTDCVHGETVGFLIDLDWKNVSDDFNTELIFENTLRTYTDLPPSFSFYENRWNDISYRPETGFMDISGFFWIAYLVIIIFGIQIAFAIAIIMSSSKRENQYFSGILLARGFGRKGLFKILCSQILIIYSIGLLVGLGIGLGTSYILTYLMNSLVFSGINMPVFFNPIELFQILGIIIGISLGIFMISYLFEIKKSIAEYLY